MENYNVYEYLRPLTQDEIDTLPKELLQERDRLIDEGIGDPKVERTAKLKRLLAETDYKVMPDYDRPSAKMVEDRQAWRDEIRKLSKSPKEQS